MTPPPAPASPFQQHCLGLFFAAARRLPRLTRLARRPVAAAVWLAAPAVRRAVHANLRHVLGPDAPPRRRRRIGRAVIASFYDFVCDVAAHHRDTPPQLLARIESIEGKAPYLDARQPKRGAILVTAHFGNFEVGLAAIREIEPRVHVVFQRDAQSRFERLRATLHRSLGVTETPINDGMASWLALRDALDQDAVVLLQGDRASPGQKTLDVPCFGATLRLPVGPAKLALLTGAPLVPVFATRLPGRQARLRIALGQPLWVPTPDALEPALHQIARSLEHHIAPHPEQWHVLHPAFVEPAS
ncbi:MAG: lysophospholipid acyltransferase family protein [Planctomycetota bacterium]